MAIDSGGAPQKNSRTT